MQKELANSRAEIIEHDKSLNDGRTNVGRYGEALKDQLLAKDIRQATPRGGKIDYDSAGTLAGNWFQQGSGGYIGKDPANYWVTHLAFAYDAIDPSHLIVSLGSFNSQPQQFGVKGNSPDPATVKMGQLVKYDLVPWQWYKGDGKVWDGQSYANGLHAKNIDDQIKGVVLVELTDASTLKMEAFPGKSSADIKDFDEKAVIYNR